MFNALKVRAFQISANLQEINDDSSFKFKKTNQLTKENSRHRLKTEYVIAIIGAVTTILTAIIGIFPQLFKSPPIPTTTMVVITEYPSSTFTAFAPSETPFPSLTPIITATPTFTFTPTSFPTETTDAKGVSMVLVSEGEFMMGSASGEENEQPTHLVYLYAYYIDKYETTNAEYSQCVNSGVCSQPKQISSSTRLSYYDNIQYSSFPVLYVDWQMAYDYCKWRDARLPTEAEWEKAAHGYSNNLFPWGNEIDCSYANFNNCIGDTTSVGSYLSSTSPFGAYDMAGNVWEWLQDWDQDYSVERIISPQGPLSGIYHSARGGGWESIGFYVRTTDRHGLLPDTNNSITGIRCARYATP